MFQRFDKGSVHMNRSDWILGPGLKLDLKVIELRMSGSDVPRPPRGSRRQELPKMVILPFCWLKISLVGGSNF